MSIKTTTDGRAVVANGATQLETQRSEYTTRQFVEVARVESGMTLLLIGSEFADAKLRADRWISGHSIELDADQAAHVARLLLAPPARLDKAARAAVRAGQAE